MPHYPRQGLSLKRPAGGVRRAAPESGSPPARAPGRRPRWAARACRGRLPVNCADIKLRAAPRRIPRRCGSSAAMPQNHTTFAHDVGGPGLAHPSGTRITLMSTTSSFRFVTVHQADWLPWRGAGRRVLAWLRQRTCGLLGHDAVVRFAPGHLHLECLNCGYCSPGWDVDVRRAPAPSATPLRIVATPARRRRPRLALHAARVAHHHAH